MCGIYCVYKQSRSCQLPLCASPIFHFEIGDFSVYLYIYSFVLATLTFGELSNILGMLGNPQICRQCTL